MTIDDLCNKLDGFSAGLSRNVPDIVAETAVEYSKQAFTDKKWDGAGWDTKVKVPKRTGSLLIESGALANSIDVAKVTPNEVVISAGNSRVKYAQAHNEGHKGVISIPAHTRKGKPVEAHTREIDIPARPFLGESRELLKDIKRRIEGFMSSYW